MAIKVLRPVEWPAASSVLIEADLLNNAVQQVWMIRVYARVQYSHVHPRTIVTGGMDSARVNEGSALNKRVRPELRSADGDNVRVVPELLQAGSRDGGVKCGYGFDSDRPRGVLRAQDGPHVGLDLLRVLRPKVKVYPQQQLPRPLRNRDGHKFVKISQRDQHLYLPISFDLRCKPGIDVRCRCLLKLGLSREAESQYG